MFSLQNQNQVICVAFLIEFTINVATYLQAIFTLSQISAIVTPRQNAYLNKKQKSKIKREKQFLCPESFLEAQRNIDLSIGKYIDVKQIQHQSLFNRVSYVSTKSFFENKHNFPEEELYPTAELLSLNENGSVQISNNFYRKLHYGLLKKNNFTFDVQIRKFKTERSVTAELHRNPPLLMRVKHTLGFTGSESNDPKLNTEQAGTDRLKQMLSTDESSMTEAEKQRIKIAFAEGYLLGGNPKSGKAARYFKAMQQVLTIGIFLAIVVSLMASASGSVFRSVHSLASRRKNRNFGFL